MAINVKKLKSWETTITFFTCACGFVLGLPMTTELGIFVVYFLDYCVGGGWWLIILYLAELAAVFLIRGRPYSGETVVAALFSRAGSCLQTWIAPMLSFVWNVILPVLLMVISVTIFKNGQFREFFKWHAPMFYDYWPTWTREFGSMLQVIPLLMIPFIGIVQTCRYISNGPSDIFDRIQFLYRPPLESVPNLQDLSTQTDLETTTTTTSNNPVVEDPPPKYTPPPSYTTATGARIAKLLRQSFRRSCRRITNVFGNGETSDVPVPRVRQMLPPPPDYSAVLVEINQALATSNQNEVVISVNDANNDRTHNTAVGGESVPASSTLTASDVATILRSSFRRNVRDNVVESSSSERLVDAAAPINLDSVVLEGLEIDKEERDVRH